jgi:hypothetical protein
MEGVFDACRVSQAGAPTAKYRRRSDLERVPGGPVASYPWRLNRVGGDEYSGASQTGEFDGL